MRALLVLYCACAAYDPVAEVPHDHREFADTPSAIAAILAETTPPKIYAVGEYHPTRASADRSPISRFTDDVIGLLEPRAGELVVETWVDNCGETGMQAQLQQQLGRPAATGLEVRRLVFESMNLRKMTAHGLAISCLEHEAMRDRTGSIDFLRLLELVTGKLHDATLDALARARPTRPAVIVYGGALHNDLYPRWPLESLSYALPLAQELGGGVLELDLVVPEVVAQMPMIRQEPWFPLLGRASPARTIVWQRGPNSYVVILPAGTEFPAWEFGPPADRFDRG